MDKKEESNLILQRSVGGQDNQFREVVKDPQSEFKVIGIIRQGSISEQGRQVPIFYLYDLKGTLVASEKDRAYLEENTTVRAQEKLRETAKEKWREDELGRARGEEKSEKQAPQAQSKGKGRNSKENQGR